MPEIHTDLCQECLRLVGAGGGKQPHAGLAPMDKYRARSAKGTTTMDYRCAQCGTEWRYHRMAGWDRLGS
jgi:RNase P subunit RPR2